MNRRNFIKKTIPLSLLPLSSNILAKSLIETFQNNPSNINLDDRKLVIIQFDGANDMLNTIVPLSQYGLYGTLRPTIKIPEQNLLNLNELPNLNTALSDNQLGGLHPRMDKLYNLFGSGKVNIVHGIGYPRPNYSHFRSTDLILSAKDGNYTDALHQGWLGNFLSVTNPNFYGSPNALNNHPLGIQVGTSSESIGYKHRQLHNVGININSLAENEFYNASRMHNNLPSHYRDLLSYLKVIEDASNFYDRTIKSTFYSGNNSANVNYPVSRLGNQLKTIARLISGGIRTKVFLTNLGGFDTHVNQVKLNNGVVDTNLGRHADLMSQFSEAVYAFQKDLEALQKDENVIIITISEFGRKLKENGNFGTDHGDLSSWFVIGTPVKGGVTGNNVDLSKVGGDGRSNDPNGLQHDYRRLYSAIVQDWFGYNDDILKDIEANNTDNRSLYEFAGNEKLDVFKDSYKVSPSLYFGCANNSYNLRELTLVKVKVVDGWTYYGETNTSQTYHLAIEHMPQNGNTNDLNLVIKVHDLLNDGNCKNYFSSELNGEACFLNGKYFMIKSLGSDRPNGPINVRFFMPNERSTMLFNIAKKYKETNNSVALSPKIWTQLNVADFQPSQHLNHLGFTQSVKPLNLVGNDLYENQHYYEFNQIQDIDNFTGALVYRVSNGRDNLNTDETLQPGTIRYNKTRGKLQGWDGQKWINFH